MSDLKLVAPDQPTPLERQLLNAAANEMPSPEQRMRVRQALGLPAVAVLPLAPASNTARRALLLKAAAGGVIVISAAALLFYAGFGRTPHPNVVNPAPVAVPSTPAQPAAAIAERAPEPVAAPLPPVEPLPSNVPDVKLAPKSAHATNAAASSSASDSATDLTEQLRLIDAARSAVASGDAKSASSAISAYQTRFPRGAFGQEAAVLRIETVDLQGNHAQAASLAKSFLAKHPNSPHVSVVQRIAARAQ